ncbi:MAG: hypothetical protein PHV32_10060, partial [Eubacteriales bacterium]|nr:hypothetical protein [Eubacteriales bacterium]
PVFGGIKFLDEKKVQKPAWLLDLLAERAGFEPAWDCSQTDFENSTLSGVYRILLKIVRNYNQPKTQCC